MMMMMMIRRLSGIAAALLRLSGRRTDSAGSGRPSSFRPEGEWWPPLDILEQPSGIASANAVPRTLLEKDARAGTVSRADGTVLWTFDEGGGAPKLRYGDEGRDADRLAALHQFDHPPRCGGSS